MSIVMAGKCPSDRHDFKYGDILKFIHKPTDKDIELRHFDMAYQPFYGIVGSVLDLSSTKTWDGQIKIAILESSNPKAYAMMKHIILPAWVFEHHHLFSLGGDNTSKLISLLDELRNNTSSMNTYNTVTEILTGLGVTGLLKASIPKY